MKKNVSISNFIKTKYKEYSLYTLTSRGIPNFYDSLTPVQRIILLNSPKKFEKTLKTVGDCISNGNYHHGDASLSKSINRLTREYNCSMPLLEGDGFFGNKINEQAAASRYTSVRIKKEIDEIIKEYNFLNSRDESNNYNPLNIKVPIGLLIPVIGIAIGYKTYILPRKLKDINDFINEKRKSCPPYFKDFNGKITKAENKWLVEGEVEIDDKTKTLTITSLPPMMKYASFINKINKILEDINYEVINLSKEDINLKIIIRNNSQWDEVKNLLIKATKIMVSESIVLIKDKKVLEYETIEDYLIDFRNKNLILDQDKKEYDLKIYNFELEYLEAKKLFYEFMLKQKRSEEEIKDFLKVYRIEIKERLERIKAINLNKNQYDNIIIKIQEFKDLISELSKEIKQYDKFITNYDFTMHNKFIEKQQLFEDDEVENDIEIYNPFDEIEIEEE